MPVGAAETVGVDLGGTKMLVGVVDRRGEVVHRRLSVSAGLTAAELLARLDEEIGLALEARPGVAAVGLGVPCIVDRGRELCVISNHLPLVGLPLRARIAELTGLPAAIDNDGNAAVLAEQRRGAAKGAENVVMLTLGTGIGGGLILDGGLYRGTRGAAAELGHFVVDIDGPPCPGRCPNNGCIEALVSGTALGLEAERAIAANPDSALARAADTGARPDGALVTDLARKGDPISAGLLETMGRRLGYALTGLANVFDPDVIVIGGGVVDAGDLLLGPARSEFERRALTPQRETPIRPAELGPDAGMIGASILGLGALAKAGVAA
ncbi:MAG: ROK family protein [Solirubrobacterales bacterium]|nr:ROK family protein [Solirubrobacterales bacterium]